MTINHSRVFSGEKKKNRDTHTNRIKLTFQILLEITTNYRTTKWIYPVFNLQRATNKTFLYGNWWNTWLFSPKHFCGIFLFIKTISKLDTFRLDLIIQVSITSFTIVTILYTCLAFTGAKLFGPSVSSQITLSMPPHQIATKIALWATVLTPMTKYALEFAPFAIQLEQNLPTSMGRWSRTLIRGSVGSILLLLILALALSAPYFQYVLSLTGSLVSIGISLVFPSAFYLKICGRQVPKSVVVLNLLIIIFGVVIGIIGTISSSRSLIQSIQRGKSSWLCSRKWSLHIW